MNILKATLFGLFSLISAFAFAAGGAKCHLDDPQLDLTDKAALQRGAKLYVNYCLGCHSLKYQRHSRMAQDLEIPVELVKENLMFTADKIGEHMTIAMPEADSAKWFGAAPPDLSLKSRVRGDDWLYTYLRTFYSDESRPWGVNNECFPDVGMPHVLAPLQGVQVKGEDGQLSIAKAGSMSVEQYDSAVRDLVSFMSYVGEPVQVERKTLGFWVIGFLLILLVLTYLLKREYWKDIH